MTHIIVGYGEVGQGLHKVIAKSESLVNIHDSQQGFFTDLLPGNAFDVMHICFPYSDTFMTEVNEVRQKLPAKLVIIHSTVQVGTTRALGEGVAYSFVRGRHPNLGTEMTKHMKHVGAVKPEDAISAFTVLSDLGFMCQIQTSPEAVELGKLWDTTYYGICIAATKMAKEIADQYDVKWHDMAQMNESYNETAETKFVRPQLDPNVGGLAGHCVLENTIILHKNLHKVLDLTLLEGVLALGKSTDEKKPYLNDSWLYAEHWGKKRTLEDIGREFEVSGTNIGMLAKRRGIPVRSRKWTQAEIELVQKLSAEGKNFRDISEQLENRTYDAVRNLAYKVLDLESSYDPSIVDEATRQKISVSLQGISPDEWDGFKETINSLERKSCRYIEWRNQVFERDNYTCQICQTKGVYLHAHHVKPWAKYEELRFSVDNGQTLCRECHLNLHHPKLV